MLGPMTSPAIHEPLWTNPLAAPPLRASDGLASDAPGPRRPGRIRRNPFVRLLAFLAITVVGLTAAAWGGGPLRTSDLGVGVAQLVVVTLAYLIVVFAVEGRRRPVELAPRRAMGLLAGLLLGTALFSAAFALITLFGGFEITGINPAYDPWALVFIVGVVAGVSEELMFRGMLYRLGEELVGTWGAVAISGLVFGGVHLANRDATWWGALAIALEAGLLFGLLYTVTRSLWLLIGVHAAWNVVQGPVLGIAISGTGDPGGFVETVPTGPDWLSGGAFGAEASYVAVAVMLAFTVWLGMLAARRGLIVKPWWTRRHLFPEAVSAQAVSARSA